MCRVGDAFEPATSTLVMAVAAPARASASGSYFASFYFFMGSLVPGAEEKRLVHTDALPVN